jgi:hypothetical protein
LAELCYLLGGFIMQNKIKKAFVLLPLILFLFPKQGAAQVFLDFETGGVFSGYNNVRIPGDTGTLFSLSRDLTTKSSLFYRLRLGFTFKERNHLSILYAPLTLNATGQVNQAITFFEEVFPPSIPLEGSYTFNSYRLTYRYDLLRKEKWTLGIGFTAKIRDAAVGVEGGGKSSTKTNVGFVPLIHIWVEWKFHKSLSLLLVGDALGAPQGRAEDVLLALRIPINKNILIKAGYRFVEGGANVEEVYNFTFIHYAVVGVTFTI